MAAIRTYLFVIWAVALVISEARRLRHKELNDEQEVVAAANSAKGEPSLALPVSLQQLTEGKKKYAIRSLSSGRYLDGRNPGMDDPLLSDGSRNPFSDTYLQWIITPISNTENVFSIRSVSSGRLLDGRNPGMNDVKISDGTRNPETDMYLQWQIIQLTENTFALLSQSSGQYLDGRNPQLDTPILNTGSWDPYSNVYLQFSIFALD
ncbi:hypothetical protein EMCRGX_G003097 [Ephydatia muelleri]